MIWEIIISSISSTALVGIVAFLARNWISERIKQSIKHEYDLKIKDLEHRYEKEHIEFKAFLEKDISIYKYKFEKSHNKTAETIENVYLEFVKILGRFNYFDNEYFNIDEINKNKTLKEINDRMNNIFINLMPLVLLYFGDECFDATNEVYGVLDNLYNMYIDFDLKKKGAIKTQFNESCKKMSELRPLLLRVIK